MATYFVSDLHLCTERPQQIDLFKKFLRGPARTAEAVYILGDLFENFWLGADDQTPPADEILAELRALAAINDRLYMIRGNRDLMFDGGFEERSGCRLLADESVINLNNTPVLLMHGDLLCSRDRKYQRFRAFLETPFIRKLYLSLPYVLRRLLGHGLRPLMKRSSAGKAPHIIDVDPDTVIATLQRHGVTTLIHGHTHRPAIHELSVDGTPATRIVLGDWYQGSSLLVAEGDKRYHAPVEKLLQQEG